VQCSISCSEQAPATYSCSRYVSPQLPGSTHSLPGTHWLPLVLGPALAMLSTPGA
jgi:hypothetical protein